jgi:hypothetical protein
VAQGTDAGHGGSAAISAEPSMSARPTGASGTPATKQPAFPASNASWVTYEQMAKKTSACSFMPGASCPGDSSWASPWST